MVSELFIVKMDFFHMKCVILIMEIIIIFTHSLY
jgi:hypothetical protein